MKKLVGRNGSMRILDSSAILHGTAPLDGHTVDVVHFDGASTWTNITANVIADDTNYANNFLADNNDVVYIGSTSKFALIRFLKGGGADYAAGSGALLAYYFNGSNFSSALAGVVDGTASGGNCFAADGYISFKQPVDWALGANAFNANLDADKYYVALKTTTSATTDPDADVLCPCDGQYLTVPFALMDFSGPLGRPRQEEILVLDRDTMSADGHYIKGPDDKLMEPLEISFSCYIDSSYGDRVIEALECDNPNAGTWTGTGVSTKSDTRNDGVNANPAFADSDKKSVNVQIKWGLATGYAFGMAYYECFFERKDVSVAEGADGTVLKAKGMCYGRIETITGFGNRY